MPVNHVHSGNNIKCMHSDKNREAFQIDGKYSLTQAQQNTINYKYSIGEGDYRLLQIENGVILSTFDEV